MVGGHYNMRNWKRIAALGKLRTTNTQGLTWWPLSTSDLIFHIIQIPIQCLSTETANEAERALNWGWEQSGGWSSVVISLVIRLWNPGQVTFPK